MDSYGFISGLDQPVILVPSIIPEGPIVPEHHAGNRNFENWKAVHANGLFLHSRMRSPSALGCIPVAELLVAGTQLSSLGLDVQRWQTSTANWPWCAHTFHMRRARDTEETPWDTHGENLWHTLVRVACLFDACAGARRRGLSHSGRGDATHRAARDAPRAAGTGATGPRVTPHKAPEDVLEDGGSMV